VIAGKCLGSTLLTQGLLLCTAAIAVVITHTPLALAGLPWFVLGFVLVAASGTAMGFALCSVFVLTRHALQVTSALMYPVYILAGLLIPPHFLPGPLAWLSHLISLYWLNQFLDQAAHGAFAVRPLIFLVLLTLAYFWAGGVLFGRVVDRARRKGTIDLG
jgi:ABC-2 type transport system permease protein